MSFQIVPGRDLSGEVTDVAREQLREAAAMLADQPDGRHKAVHGARKRFKKLRALYRLIRSGAPDFYAAENLRLRDIARTLSLARDAAALVEAADRLADQAGSLGEQEVLLSVSHRLAERRDRIEHTQSGLNRKIKAAIAACKDADSALSAISLPSEHRESAKTVASGFARCYGNAVSTFQHAEASGVAADWHELRKHCKYHWMQVRLLGPLWPGEFAMRAEAAKAAAETLGEDHDLDVLLALVKSEPETIGPPREIKVLRKVIGVTSARLRDDVRRIAVNLLHDDKDLVKSRIRALYLAAAK